jgi:hypothetical protein
LAIEDWQKDELLKWKEELIEELKVYNILESDLERLQLRVDVIDRINAPTLRERAMESKYDNGLKKKISLTEAAIDGMRESVSINKYLIETIDKYLA